MQKDARNLGDRGLTCNRPDTRHVVDSSDMLVVTAIALAGYTTSGRVLFDCNSHGDRVSCDTAHGCSWCSVSHSALPTVRRLPARASV